MLTDVTLGDIVGVSGEAVRSRRGELSLQLDSYELLARQPAPAAGPVPRPRRRRDALPPALPRPAGESARCAPTCELRARVVSSLRRELDAAGFVEVETPVLQPLYGGANARPFTTHPQRARPRPLPAHRHRALPQAADRRRPRARLRARQGLPQRGRVVQAQPRVHDARVVRGLRATSTTRMARTEALVAAAAIAANGTTIVERDGGRGRPGAALAAGVAARGDRGAHPGSTRSPCATPSDLRAPRGRGGRGGGRRRHDLAAARRPAALPLRRAARHVARSSSSTTRSSSRRSRAGARTTPSMVERFEAFASAWRSRTASPS